MTYIADVYVCKYLHLKNMDITHTHIDMDQKYRIESYSDGLQTVVFSVLSYVITVSLCRRTSVLWLHASSGAFHNFLSYRSSVAVWERL